MQLFELFPSRDGHGAGQDLSVKAQEGVSSSGKASLAVERSSPQVYDSTASMEHDQLCTMCSLIKFDPQADPPWAGFESYKDRHALGTFGDVSRRKRCPLCRLVCHVLGNSRDASVHQEPYEVYLERHEIGLNVRGCSFAVISPVVDPSFRQAKYRWSFPISQKRVDYNRLLYWIDCCIAKHEDCRVKEFRRPAHLGFGEIAKLRLIDVVERRIVEVQMPTNYVALSYVWGGVPNFRLTTNNLPALSKPGAITKIWHRLPRTIRDAIEVTEGLKERYLWVDSLCLIQNDRTDMKNGIVVMDLIYELANLTIIAASGSHADAGLPGVGCTSRPITQYIEHIQPGLDLAVYFDIEHLLSQTAYNRRGWTFQEQILSRRGLYFINNEVYFRCRESICSENTVDSKPGNRVMAYDLDMSPSILPFATTALFDLPAPVYTYMVRYYTERTLSDQNDTLLAMAGIIRRISQEMKCRFFQGMPTAAFDLFVSFCPANSILRRRKLFPSYSWTGWIGQVTCEWDRDTDPNSFLCNSTWIQWYKRSPEGALNPVWDIMANEAFPRADLKYIGYRSTSEFGNRHQLATTRTSPTHNLSFERPVPSYHMLQFWTLSAHFRLGDIEAFKAQADIVDRNGTKCGWLWMDGFEDDEFFQTGLGYEFILLSDGEYKKCTACEYKDPHQNGFSKPYYAMVLQWKGGVAERRGFGVLCRFGIDRSLSPGPSWKEILLA